MLGQLVLLDHLEGLGYGGVVAQNLTSMRSLQKLVRTAVVFGVRCEPPVVASSFTGRRQIDIRLSSTD